MVNIERYLINQVSEEEYKELRERYGKILEDETVAECEGLPFLLDFRYNPDAKTIGIHIKKSERTYLAGTEEFERKEETTVRLLKTVVNMRLRDIRVINGPWKK